MAHTHIKVGDKNFVVGPPRSETTRDPNAPLSPRALELEAELAPIKAELAAVRDTLANLPDVAMRGARAR